MSGTTMSDAIVVAPTNKVSTALTVTMTLTGAASSGSVVLSSPIAWLYGQSRMFNILTGSNLGDLTVAFGKSGSDASKYVAVPNRVIPVSREIRLSTSSFLESVGAN